jgi:hypothetical protein
MPIRSLAAAVATPRGRRIAVCSVLAVAAVGWWWYPSLTNKAAGTDVAIVGDSFLQGAEREVTYRIHEDGYSLVWATTGSTGVAATESTVETTTTVPGASELTWCDAPRAVQDAIEHHHPEIVIVSFAEEGSCGTDPVAVREAVRSAAGSTKLIVVTNPAAEDAPVPADSIVVRPSRLIGPIGNTTEGCLWFDSDTCQPNGRVDVRTADGALSPSGQTRIARLIVTALR